MLVAIEDISGQIGHNYMRDKYVKTFQTIWILKCLHCFSQLQLTLLSLAGKVETFWRELDVEVFDEAVGEEEPRPHLQCLPSAEPQRCHELRGWGEGSHAEYHGGLKQSKSKIKKEMSLNQKWYSFKSIYMNWFIKCHYISPLICLIYWISSSFL